MCIKKLVYFEESSVQPNMASCCVESCSSRPGCPGVSFFRFPVIRDIAEAQRRNAWLKAIGEVKMNLEGADICSRHFVLDRPVKLEVSQADTNDSSEICRLCLGKEEKLMKLFQDGTGTNSALLKQIYDCTTLEIRPEATYPAAICATCYAKLDEYSKFREKCIENDSILRMIMGDVGDEKNNVGSSDQSTDSQSESAAPEATSSSTVDTAYTALVPRRPVINVVGTNGSATGLRISNIMPSITNGTKDALQGKVLQNGRPKCVICSRSYQNKYTLRTHMKLHTRENLVRCAVCFKTFTVVSFLRYHMYTHRNLKVFECRVCAETAETYDKLATHVSTKHYHVQLDDLTNNNIDGSFLAGDFMEIAPLPSANSRIQDDCDMEPIPDSPPLIPAPTVKSEAPTGLPGEIEIKEETLDDVQVQLKQEPIEDGMPQSDPDRGNQVQGH